MSNIITKIEAQKRNKDRVNIYIDEEFAFACSSELVYYYNFKKGKPANEKELEDVIKEDDYIKCKSSALKYIEKSLKTEKQVMDKLFSKEYGEETVSRVIIFLKEYGFVDDYRYCDMYIREKLNNYGRNKIKYSLLNKGVKESIVNLKINSIEENKEKEISYRLAEKKYKTIISREKNKLKVYHKIWEYLMSRGYTSYVIECTINKLKFNTELDSNIQLQSSDIYEGNTKNYKENINVLAQKRYNIIIKSESDKNKIYRRLSNYLLRKGYSFEEIKNIVNQILNET